MMMRSQLGIGVDQNLIKAVKFVGSGPPSKRTRNSVSTRHVALI